MHVVVCFVFISPHFALATGFRFIVMPSLHECHCMFCFPLPPFEFANGNVATWRRGRYLFDRIFNFALCHSTISH